MAVQTFVAVVTFGSSDEAKITLIPPDLDSQPTTYTRHVDWAEYENPLANTVSRLIRSQYHLGPFHGYVVKYESSNRIFTGVWVAEFDYDDGDNTDPQDGTVYLPV